MKLFAIKNEKTGAYRKDEYGTIQAYTYAPLPSSCKKDEVVVELSPRPSKPCECCGGRWWGELNYQDEGSGGDWETLMADKWSLCPNCGRTLT